MKICYIISDIDKAVYFEETALELRKQGVELSFILLSSTNKTLHRFLVDKQFQVKTFEVGSLLKSGKVIRLCKNLLKEWNITTVHCHLAQANWVGLWASKLVGIKTRIYTRHSGKPLKTHWKEKLIDRIQNKLATQIIAISDNIDQLLAEQLVPSNKRMIIHHGFMLERFAHPDSTDTNRIKNQYNPENLSPNIGVIARWMEWKGIHYIIDAFSTLLNEYPQARLYLFGASDNADFSEEIQKKLQQIPARNYCVVPFEPNVFDLYQLFDVYVHVPVNPRCEAFGQTYVEALAAGIPSVFTLSGVAREFIQHEKNALIVPFENSQAIYEAITRMIRDPKLAETLIERGKQDVKDLFEFQTAAEKLVNLYRNHKA